MSFISSRYGCATLFVLLALLAPAGRLHAQKDAQVVDAQTAAASTGCQAPHSGDTGNGAHVTPPNGGRAIRGEKSDAAIYKK